MIGYVGVVPRPDVVGCINLAATPETFRLLPGKRYKFVLYDFDGVVEQSRQQGSGGAYHIWVGFYKNNEQISTGQRFSLGAGVFEKEFVVQGGDIVTGASVGLSGNSSIPFVSYPFRVAVEFLPLE